MKIGSYENDNNISLSDKLTGTDADNSKKTKSYTFQAIKDFFIAQGLGSGGTTDISGKVVFTMNQVTSDSDMNLSKLQHGIYFAKMTGEGIEQTEKIILK